MKYLVVQGQSVQHDGKVYAAGDEIPEMGRAALQRLLDLGAVGAPAIAPEAAADAVDEVARLRGSLADAEALLADADREVAALKAEIAALKAGKPKAPPKV